MGRYRLGGIVCCLIWFAVFSFSVFAQSERGTITGAVRDSTGPRSGRQSDRHEQRNQRGAQRRNKRPGRIHSPQPAAWHLHRARRKAGFRPTEEKGLTVDAADNVRADVKLEVGASTQAVEVQATAVQLQTEDAKNSVTLENKLVNDLPLVVNGTVRTPFDLASLTPDAKNLGGDNGFSVGGGQVASYGTSLDGVSTNTSRALSKSWVASNSPSVEAIDQFTVDTNGYKAEYGHAAAAT